MIEDHVHLGHLHEKVIDLLHEMGNDLLVKVRLSVSCLEEEGTQRGPTTREHLRRAVGNQIKERVKI